MSEQTSYLTYRLGGELFAVDVRHVREILDVSSVTRVPTAPPYVRGLVNVRGRAVPIVDLHMRLGLPTSADGKHTRFVVLEVPIDGEPCVIGARTDSVHDVMELAAADIEPPRSLGRRWRTDVLRGIARRGEEFVLVIDVAQLFVDDKALLQDHGNGVEAAA